MDKRLKFSQRMGFSPVKSEIQINSMDDELRTLLWNAFYKFSYEDHYVLFHSNENSRRRDEILWTEVFGGRVDELPGGQYLQDEVKMVFVHLEWHHVYELVEEFYRLIELVYYNDSAAATELYTFDINEALEKGLSGYRLISGNIRPVAKVRGFTAGLICDSVLKGIGAPSTWLNLMHPVYYASGNFGI